MRFALGGRFFSCRAHDAPGQPRRRACDGNSNGLGFFVCSLP